MLNICATYFVIVFRMLKSSTARYVLDYRVLRKLYRVHLPHSNDLRTFGEDSMPISIVVQFVDASVVTCTAC